LAWLGRPSGTIDAALARINVNAFRRWGRGRLPCLVPLRAQRALPLATVGSLLVIVVLALPSASAHFR
jgi:hypothetical protein